MVDLVVDQAEHVGGGVQDHLSGEGPARPVLLVPPVDVLQLVLHRVDRCAVALAEGVQSDALRLVHRTAGLLEGEDGVGRLGVEDAPQGDVVLVVQVDGVVATIVYDLNNIGTLQQPFEPRLDHPRTRNQVENVGKPRHRGDLQESQLTLDPQVDPLAIQPDDDLITGKRPVAFRITLRGPGLPHNVFDDHLTLPHATNNSRVLEQLHFPGLVVSLVVQQRLSLLSGVFLERLQHQIVDPLLESLVVIRGLGFGVGRGRLVFRRFGIILVGFPYFKGDPPLVALSRNRLRGRRRSGWLRRQTLRLSLRQLLLVQLGLLQPVADRPGAQLGRRRRSPLDDLRRVLLVVDQILGVLGLELARLRLVVLQSGHVDMFLADFGCLQECHQVGLDVETVAEQSQEAGQMSRGVEQIGPHALGEVAADDLEQLLDQDGPLHLDALRQEVQQRLGGLRVDLHVRLEVQLLGTVRPDRGVIGQDDGLFLVVDGERVGVLEQELAELVEVLAGDVTHLGAGLRAVP
jgi:hypothetical protein